MGRAWQALSFIVGFGGCAAGVEGPETEGCDDLGAPAAVIGRWAQEQFVSFDDGDPIAVVPDGNSARFRLDYLVYGFEPGTLLTVVVRVGRSGQGTEDFMTTANLDCVEPGPPTYGAHVGWPPLWPLPAFMHGETLHVDTVFVDEQGTAAEVGVDLVVDAQG